MAWTRGTPRDSPVVLTSMTGSANNGKASSRCFDSNARSASSSPTRRVMRWSMASSLLSMRQAPPACMLSLVRDHWAIENTLHHRRDVSLGEDACQTRTGPVPGLLAQLNSTVLSLMDRAGVGNVARQMRSFDAHYEQALALLLTGWCSGY